MDNPLGIPPEDLPEPIRRMLEEAQARGDQVRIIPLGKNPGGILSQLVELGENGRDSEAQQSERRLCDCAWCRLEHGIIEVNKTEQLDRDQKYEAALRLFTEAADRAAAEGDIGNALSMRMQGLGYDVHKENRVWLAEQVESRVEALIRQAADMFGIDSTDPSEVLSKVAQAAVDQAQSDGPDAMMRCASVALKLKDLLKLRNKLKEPQEFEVLRVPISQLSQHI